MSEKSYKYTCPNCQFVSSDFTVSENLENAKCPRCHQVSKTHKFLLDEPETDPNSKTINLMPHGYCNLRSALTLTQAHEEFEAAQKASHAILVSLDDILEMVALEDNDHAAVAEQALKHIEKSYALQNKFIQAMCGEA